MTRSWWRWWQDWRILVYSSLLFGHPPPHEREREWVRGPYSSSVIWLDWIMALFHVYLFCDRYHFSLKLLLLTVYSYAKVFLTPSPLLPLWETICLSPLSTPSITSTNTETNPQAANTNTRESYNSYHSNVFLENFSDSPSTVIVASYRQLPEVTLWNANHWKSESILKRNPEISIAFRKLFHGTVKKVLFVDCHPALQGPLSTHSTWSSLQVFSSSLTYDKGGPFWIVKVVVKMPQMISTIASRFLEFELFSTYAPKNLKPN